MKYHISVADNNGNALTREYEITEDKLADKEEMGEIIIDMIEANKSHKNEETFSEMKTRFYEALESSIEEAEDVLKEIEDAGFFYLAGPLEADLGEKKAQSQCPTCHKEHCQCYETHNELNE